jgi:aconitate hydratase
MGIMPLQFNEGENRESLGLDGSELFMIELDDSLKPHHRVPVTATGKNGEKKFEMVARIDTPVEVEYYRNGGILHTVLRQMVKKG